MIVLSNSTSQTIPAGGTVSFDTTVLKSGCSECHRAGSGSIKMKTRTTYRVTFNGTISGVTGTEQDLVIALGDENLKETQMASTPSAASTSNSIAASTLVNSCCSDYSHITVKNNGTSTVTLGAYPSLTLSPVCNCY